MDNLKQDNVQHKPKKDNKNSDLFKRWFANIGYDCPHTHCGQHFTFPINKKGILFCPHCQQSILLNDPNNELKLVDIKIRKFNFQFEWKYLTKPKYWLLCIIFLFILVLFRWIQSHILDEGFYLILTCLYLSYIFLILLKSYLARGYRDFLLIFTHYNKPIYAGVDNLVTVTKYPFTYVAPNGYLIVNQPTNRDIFSSYDDINCCLQCHSQQLINLNTVLILDSKFFETHHIPRPKQFPKSGFNFATKTYVNMNKSKYIVCLNCLSYFQWKKLKPSIANKNILFYIIKIFKIILNIIFFMALLIFYLAIIAIFSLCIDMAMFYIMSNLPTSDLALFSLAWWKRSMTALAYFLVTSIYLQFIFFIIFSAKWDKIKFNKNKITLQQLKMDY
ncbi:hypothetical protein [Psychrobacter sp. I-STPA10]|uniref:hypothetical protein n=1 Tax=Psychrobacter sp. I-STPA10 TaxID=2585769 RepID=UPI001E4DC34D|nr:hypothetical protein [Psychrobacter sp. I-STPA10]